VSRQTELQNIPSMSQVKLVGFDSNQGVSLDVDAISISVLPLLASGAT
jgi:hypothetical protein